MYPSVDGEATLYTDVSRCTVIKVDDTEHCTDSIRDRSPLSQREETKQYCSGNQFQYGANVDTPLNKTALESERTKPGKKKHGKGSKRRNVTTVEETLECCTSKLSGDNVNNNSSRGEFSRGDPLPGTAEEESDSNDDILDIRDEVTSGESVAWACAPDRNQNQPLHRRRSSSPRTQSLSEALDTLAREPNTEEVPPGEVFPTKKSDRHNRRESPSRKVRKSLCVAMKLAEESLSAAARVTQLLNQVVDVYQHRHSMDTEDIARLAVQNHAMIGGMLASGGFFKSKATSDMEIARYETDPRRTERMLHLLDLPEKRIDVTDLRQRRRKHSISESRPKDDMYLSPSPRYRDMGLSRDFKSNNELRRSRDLDIEPRSERSERHRSIGKEARIIRKYNERSSLSPERRSPTRRDRDDVRRELEKNHGDILGIDVRDIPEEYCARKCESSAERRKQDKYKLEKRRHSEELGIREHMRRDSSRSPSRMHKETTQERKRQSSSRQYEAKENGSLFLVEKGENLSDLEGRKMDHLSPKRKLKTSKTAREFEDIYDHGSPKAGKKSSKISKELECSREPEKTYKNSREMESLRNSDSPKANNKSSRNSREFEGNRYSDTLTANHKSSRKSRDLEVAKTSDSPKTNHKLSKNSRESESIKDSDSPEINHQSARNLREFEGTSEFDSPKANHVEKGESHSDCEGQKVDNHSPKTKRKTSKTTKDFEDNYDHDSLKVDHKASKNSKEFEGTKGSSSPLASRKNSKCYDAPKAAQKSSRSTRETEGFKAHDSPETTHKSSKNMKELERIQKRDKCANTERKHRKCVDGSEQREETGGERESRGVSPETISKRLPKYKESEKREHGHKEGKKRETKDREDSDRKRAGSPKKTSKRREILEKVGSSVDSPISMKSRHRSPEKVELERSAPRSPNGSSSDECTSNTERGQRRSHRTSRTSNKRVPKGETIPTSNGSPNSGKGDMGSHKRKLKKSENEQALSPDTVSHTRKNQKRSSTLKPVTDASKPTRSFEHERNKSTPVDDPSLLQRVVTAAASISVPAASTEGKNRSFNRSLDVTCCSEQNLCVPIKHRYPSMQENVKTLRTSWDSSNDQESQEVKDWAPNQGRFQISSDCLEEIGCRESNGCGKPSDRETDPLQQSPISRFFPGNALQRSQLNQRNENGTSDDLHENRILDDLATETLKLSDDGDILCSQRNSFHRQGTIRSYEGKSNGYAGLASNESSTSGFSNENSTGSSTIKVNTRAESTPEHFLNDQNPAASAIKTEAEENKFGKTCRDTVYNKAIEGEQHLSSWIYARKVSDESRKRSYTTYDDESSTSNTSDDESDCNPKQGSLSYRNSCSSNSSNFSSPEKSRGENLLNSSSVSSRCATGCRQDTNEISSPESRERRPEYGGLRREYSPNLAESPERDGGGDCGAQQLTSNHTQFEKQESTRRTYASCE